MGVSLTPARRRLRDDLVRRATRAEDVAEVFAVAAGQLRALVPHDAAAWLATDPTTGFPTAPTRIEGIAAMTARLCSDHWRHELVDDDVNRFRDLLRTGTAAAALGVTAGDPHRSRRFRRFLRPNGFADELRAVLRSGAAPWGTLTLWRREGGPPFSRAETALVAGLTAPLGEALRTAVARSRPAAVGGQDGPGVVVLDADDRPISVDEQARGWLAELPDDDAVPSEAGVAVPIWLLLTAARARDSGDGTARIRVRTRAGRWLVCHAAATRTADGTPAATVLVVEPAGPPLLAPLLAAAYGLTERERQVTGLIARGAGTEDIARTLYLSAHTVKDHVKAVLAKAGVSSRGELVAALFAEHAEPVHLAGSVHRPRT